MTYWSSSVSYSVGESPSLESVPSQRNFMSLLRFERLQVFARQTDSESAAARCQAALCRPGSEESGALLSSEISGRSDDGRAADSGHPPDRPGRDGVPLPGVHPPAFGEPG